MTPPRPPAGVRAACAVGGPALNAAVLLAPAALAGRLRGAASDPAVWTFLALAGALVLADLPTATAPPASPADPPADRRARAGSLAASLALLATFWAALLTRSPRPVAWSVSGAGLMAAGVALRAAAVRALGVGFVSKVVVADGRALHERGPYRWVRHPSETGNLSAALGAGVLLGSWYALGVAAGILLPLTLWRVAEEERALADAFGPRYESYARRVRRLLPFVY